jgi:aminomethyltransferase
MVDINHSQLANELDIEIDDKLIKGTVVQKPFFDPKKEITKKSL